MALRVVVLVVAAALILAPQSAVLAEQKQEPRPQPQLPVTVEQALYMVRSTLLTLNDANRTGNYTVLRDLAAPGFQAKNTAADLALIFADMRQRNLDLGAVAMVGPQLSTAPYLDPDKILRLTGHFPTQPLQINFDLMFQKVDAFWRLYGISVVTPQAPPPPPTPDPNAQTKPQKK